MNDVQQQSTLLASSTAIINNNNSSNNTNTKCKSSCSSTCSSSCSSVSSSSGTWGTWEDLLLASAVLKHGTGNWNSVARELQCRALIVSPTLFSPEACKCRFWILNGRFSSCGDTISGDGSIPWIEEVRKLRIAQLKRELEQFDDSIGLLQKKLKRLKAEDADKTLNIKSDHDKKLNQNVFASEKIECGLEHCLKNDQNFTQELHKTGLEGSLSAEAESSSEIQCSVKEQVVTTKEFSEYEEDRKITTYILPKEDDGLQRKNQNEVTDLKDELLQRKDQNETNDLRDKSQKRKNQTEATDLRDELLQRKDQNETADLRDESQQTEKQTETADLSYDSQQRKDQNGTTNLGDEHAENNLHRSYSPVESLKSVDSLSTVASIENGQCSNTISDGIMLVVKTEAEEKQNEEGCVHIQPKRHQNANVVSTRMHSDNVPSVQEGTSLNENSTSFEDSVCGANAMDLLRMAYEDVPESDCFSPEPVSGTVNSTSGTPILEAEKTFSSVLYTPIDESPCVISVDGAAAKSKVVGLPRSPRSTISYEHQDHQVMGSVVQGSCSNVDAVGRKLQPCINHSSDESSNLSESDHLSHTPNKRIKVDNKKVGETSYEGIPRKTSDDSNKLDREDLVAKKEEGNLCEVLKNEESNTGIDSEVGKPVQADLLDDKPAGPDCKPMWSINFQIQSVDNLKKGDLDVPPESLGKIVNQMHVEQARTDSVIKDNDDEHPMMNKIVKTERYEENITESSAPQGDSCSVLEGELKAKTSNPVTVDTFSSSLQRSSVYTEDEVKANDSTSDEDDELLVDMMKLKGTDLLTLRRRKVPPRSGSSIEDLLLSKEKGVQSGDQKRQHKTIGEHTSEPSPNIPLSNEGCSPKNIKIKIRSSEELPTGAEQPLVSTHNDFLHDSFGGKGSTVEVFSTRRSRLKLRKPEPICEETSKSQNAGDASGSDIGTVSSKVDQATSEPVAEEVSVMEAEMNSGKKFLPDLITLLECLRMISAHRFAPFFKLRPEIQGNSRYKNVVKRHMDLNAVRSKLEEGRYSASREFFRDMLLIFSNALVFYSKGSQEYDAARVLREFLVKEMERLLKDENVPRNDPTHKEVIYADPKLDQETNVSESVMTYSEKQHDRNSCETCLDTQSGTKEPQVSISKNDDLGESPLIKEPHIEVRKQGVTTKNIRRGKSKSNTQRIEDNKVDKIPEQKDFYKIQKDKYSESLDDNHLRPPSKKDTFTSQGTKRAAQTPPKAAKDHILKKERTDKNRSSKYASGRQPATPKEETKKIPGSARSSRSSHQSKQSSKSNQPQKQNRSWL